MEEWDLIPAFLGMWERSVDTRARRSPAVSARQHHLLFFSEANQMLSLGERMLSLEDGCVAVVPRGSEYAFSYGTQCRYFCLSFLPPEGVKSPLLTAMLHRRSSLLRPRDLRRRDHLLYQAGQLHGHLGAGVEQSVPKNAYRNACFVKILLDVYALQQEDILDAALDGRELMESRVRAYLERNYQAPIALADLEKAFFTSRYQLCRLFRAQTGTTIFAYLRDLRVEHARKLLLGTDKNVTNVCFESGFQNVQSFYTAFRDRTGKTPLGYRKERREGGMTTEN